MCANSSLHNPNHRWKVLGIGVAANASFSAAFQGIPTTAVFMRSDYHLGNAELGLVLGLLGLGIALSELPWGLLTDRWGDRRVLLVGLGATAISLALMAFFAAPTPTAIPSLLTLAIGMLAVGIMGGSVNGSSGRAVMSWFREGERGFAMSIRQTAVPAGGAFGALVLPSLASQFGFAFVYGILALLCAVTVLFTWQWLHEPPLVESVAPVDLIVRQAATVSGPVSRVPLHDAKLWRLAIGIGVLCAPQFAVLTFTAIFLHDFCNAGVTTISATLVTVQVGAAIMRVWSGRWTDRKGNRRAYLRACSLLSASLFAVLAVIVMFAISQRQELHVGVTVTIIVTLVMGGICVSAWHGVAYTELATLAGTRRIGVALGMGNTCAFIALFLTPLAIPGLLALWSWPAVWLVAAACGLIAHPLFPRPIQLPLATKVQVREC
ncbi:MAG TPA: MFS transporter [Gallionella sp.]|jgi:MFS family permease|uniref:Major facilitator superfamily (MFS) transporter n=1 Tax=mine drainage metagenome TaxID=410659 RepID=E6QVJ2_9ZZZZ|nr:MFS transporter [Gallionella sp.]